jgi:hypothetical protein
MNKRGLAAIVTTLLVILLVLVAVGVVWGVVRNVIVENSEKVSLGRLTLDVEVNNVKTNGDNLEVSVTRNSGAGELSGISFAISDGINTQVFERETTMIQLDTEVFSFHVSEFIDIVDIAFVKEVIIVPILETSKGEEFFGDNVDEFEIVGESCSTNCGTSECGPSPNGCGGANACGACGSQSTCSVGTCECNAGWGDCDDDNACECDLNTNQCSGGSCIVQPASPGYNVAADFESDFGDWINVTDGVGDDEDWRRNSGGTSSYGTGPSSAADETIWYVYFEASGATYPPRDAILESPDINFDDGINDKINFYYHMYGSTMGNLFFEENTGGSWNILWSKSGNHGDIWFNEEISLSSLIGTGKLRFRGVTSGSGWSGDIAIDEIIISGDSV